MEVIHPTVTAPTNVNELIGDGKLPDTPLGGDMTGGQDPQLEPAARVAANECISATTGKLIDEGRQTDTVDSQTHSCATNQLAETMTDARHDVSDLEFQRLSQIYNTDAETVVNTCF